MGFLAYTENNGNGGLHTLVQSNGFGLVNTSKHTPAPSQDRGFCLKGKASAPLTEEFALKILYDAFFAMRKATNHLEDGGATAIMSVTYKAADGNVITIFRSAGDSLFMLFGEDGCAILSRPQICLWKQDKDLEKGTPIPKTDDPKIFESMDNCIAKGSRPEFDYVSHPIDISYCVLDLGKRIVAMALSDGLFHSLLLENYYDPKLHTNEVFGERCSRTFLDRKIALEEEFFNKTAAHLKLHGWEHDHPRFTEMLARHAHQMQPSLYGIDDNFFAHVLTDTLQENEYCVKLLNDGISSVSEGRKTAELATAAAKDSVLKNLNLENIPFMEPKAFNPHLPVKFRVPMQILPSEEYFVQLNLTLLSNDDRQHAIARLQRDHRNILDFNESTGVLKISNPTLKRRSEELLDQVTQAFKNTNGELDTSTIPATQIAQTPGTPAPSSATQPGAPKVQL